MRNTKISDIIKIMDIGKLKPYPNNPRKNDDAVLPVVNSISQFGFKDPIIVDKDNVIIAGHTRLKAAKQLGMTEVPVIVADDLTPEQAKTFRLVHNKTGELAGWDFEKLADEIALLPDVDLTDFGFLEDTPDIDGMFEEQGVGAEAKGAENNIHIVTCPHCGTKIEVDDEFNVMHPAEGK